jgi:hypothetical protein
VEFIGGTTFNWGDGSPSTGSGLGPLLFQVTSIDPVSNWWFGLALDPASLPSVDTTLSHTYAAPGDYLAFLESCCRISAFSGSNAHINNPDGGYRVETLINVGSSNNSPVSVLPPIVICPIDALCSFPIQAGDADGDQLTYRLSTPTEAGGFLGFVQPGPPFAPNPAGVDPVSGVYTWDTTGATLIAGFNTLYSTQVIIEDGNSRVALDFLIQLAEVDPSPPVLEPPLNSPPLCQSTLVTGVGDTLVFEVIASDPDAGDTVALNVVGLPLGAATNPVLPTIGNPVMATFEWAPAQNQIGVQVVNFTATSSAGGFATCPVTIEVVEQVEIAASLDIKPGSCPNGFQPDAKGVLPVALLGTDEFDVMQVDLATLLLSRADGVGDQVSPSKLAFEDAGTPFAGSPCDCHALNGDGWTDLSLKFKKDTLVAALQLADMQAGEQIELVLGGNLLDGTPFVASDCIARQALGSGERHGG